jgi:hypothetical protein
MKFECRGVSFNFTILFLPFLPAALADALRTNKTSSSPALLQLVQPFRMKDRRAVKKERRSYERNHV